MPECRGCFIGAYSMLDGTGAIGTPSGTPALKDASGGIWEVSADNWIYGSVAGGDRSIKALILVTNLI